MSQFNGVGQYISALEEATGLWAASFSVQMSLLSRLRQAQDQLGAAGERSVSTASPVPPLPLATSPRTLNPFKPPMVDAGTDTRLDSIPYWRCQRVGGVGIPPSKPPPHVRHVQRNALQRRIPRSASGTRRQARSTWTPRNTNRTFKSPRQAQTTGRGRMHIKQDQEVEQCQPLSPYSPRSASLRMTQTIADTADDVEWRDCKGRNPTSPLFSPVAGRRTCALLARNLIASANCRRRKYTKTTKWQMNSCDISVKKRAWEDLKKVRAKERMQTFNTIYRNHLKQRKAEPKPTESIPSPVAEALPVAVDTLPEEFSRSPCNTVSCTTA